MEERKTVEQNNTEKKRMLHYDLLRIFACFSVVMLHCSAQFWYRLPISDEKWIIANSYDAVFRFGVPIFVMISGAIFLNAKKELVLKNLLIHNVMRMVIIYVVWCCFYGIFDCRNVPFQNMGWDILLREIIENRYHLWFLPMIVGIYFLIPILKSWIEHADRRNVEYFLLLFLVFQVGKETANALSKHWLIGYVSGLVRPYMVCGYLGYFILGYYIAHYGINQKWHTWIYAGGVIGMIGNVLVGNFLALHSGNAVGEIYDSFGIFTFFICLAMFLFFTEKMSKVRYSKTLEKWIKEISLNTLGIYLLHVGMLEFLETIGVHSMMISPIVGIPLLGIVIFFLCGVMASLLRRIPWIGKDIC